MNKIDAKINDYSAYLKGAKESGKAADEAGTLSVCFSRSAC